MMMNADSEVFKYTTNWMNCKVTATIVTQPRTATMLKQIQIYTFRQSFLEVQLREGAVVDDEEGKTFEGPH